MSGTLTISGMAAGLPFGEEIIGPLTITGANVIDQVDGTTLNTGDNTFSAPTGSVAVLIVLGNGGVAATVKARTNLNSGDAGLPLSPFSGIGYAVFPLSTTGVTSVILNASTSVADVSLLFI
jgi:hypothetical protein